MGKDAHAPGFYLHLAPGEVYAAVGMWRPDSPSLTKVRDGIVANPARWRRVASDEGFTALFSIEGESLRRAPKGYDPDHPLIEDLKLKEHVASRYFSEEDACAPDFVDRFADSCRVSAPYMEFLTTAVGLPW